MDGTRPYQKTLTVNRKPSSSFFFVCLLLFLRRKNVYFTGLYGRCYMVELNTLTLSDISVEEHGRDIEVQGMDVPATEHLDCITEHLDSGTEHLDIT